MQIKTEGERRKKRQKKRQKKEETKERRDERKKRQKKRQGGDKRRQKETEEETEEETKEKIKTIFAAPSFRCVYHFSATRGLRMNSAVYRQVLSPSLKTRETN